MGDQAEHDSDGLRDPQRPGDWNDAPKASAPTPSERRHRQRVTLAIIGLVALLTLANVLVGLGSPRAAIPYSHFLTLVDQGRVKTAPLKEELGLSDPRPNANQSLVHPSRLLLPLERG